MTKIKLAAIYKENATLHNTLDNVYSTWFKGAETKTSISHKSGAELALAAADTVIKEADILGQQYGFTVSDT